MPFSSTLTVSRVCLPSGKVFYYNVRWLSAKQRRAALTSGAKYTGQESSMETKQWPTNLALFYPRPSRNKKAVKEQHKEGEGTEVPPSLWQGNAQNNAGSPQQRADSPVDASPVACPAEVCAFMC